MFSTKNLQVAFESLLKAKAYVFTVVITLGVTLGALVAMFDLNYQLLAAPLPYANSDDLVMFKGKRFEKSEELKDRTYPYPILRDIYQQQDSDFVQKALVDYTVSIERDWPDSPVLTTANVTPEFFSIFNVPLVLGRTFSKEEGLDFMQPVAVISYLAWEKYFSKSPEVLGKSVNIMGTHFKIVGVVAKDFLEPELDDIGNKTEIFLPFDYNDISVEIRSRWNFSMGNSFIVGKLKPGASLAAVEQRYGAKAAADFKREVASLPGLENASLSLRILPLAEAIARDSGRQSLIMFAGVLLLLLIASTNISNLLMARAADQQRNLAIQVALGAQRRDIFNAVFSEILLLMCGAFMLSLATSFGILHVIKQVMAGQFPRLQELALNLNTLLFAVIAAITLAISFALIVTHQIKYRALSNMLQTSGKGAGLQISARMRRLLILSQVALTGVLLAGSLQVLLQSMRELHQNVGYATEDQYQVHFSIATIAPNTTPEVRRDLMLRLREEISADPKVSTVGITSGSPVRGYPPFSQFVQMDANDQNRIAALQSFNDSTFFEILNLQLLEGQFYSNADVKDYARVMVVNETLAHRLQADGKVVGKIVRRVVDTSSPDGIRIIGIVKDLNLPGQQEQPRFFQALITDGPEFLIKVKPHQRLSPIELNKIAAKVSPQLKVADIHTTDEAMAMLTAHQKSAAGLTATLAVFALCLASIGIYGVLSYSVQLRRFELGIRMAIGARPQMVFWQILRDNLTAVLTGLAVALVLLVGLQIWLRSSLLNFQPSAIGWFLPLMLILLLTTATSLLAVWQVIRKPVGFSLRAME